VLGEQLDGPRWPEIAPTPDEVGALARFCATLSADVAQLTELAASSAHVRDETAIAPRWAESDALSDATKDGGSDAR
jgi:hypothetical protein